MPLPLDHPLAPQLARGRTSLPTEEGWAYEPKYDGFRAIAFVDGEAVRLCSRGGKDLERYFPEVVLPAGRYVLDGELVIDRTSLERADPPFAVAGDDPEQFDLLSQRIHPAASRIERLARETPARYLAFDLLALEDDALLERPFAERRAALEALLGRDAFAADPVVDLVPSVRTAGEAEEWLARAEGVVAKELDAPYRPGARKGMVKVKRLRTIDAVVVGWRPGKEEGTVGSLILGLYDGGELRVVGHTSGLKAKEKRELVATLAPYASGAAGSADPSRWNAERDLEWVGLRPELVVEVSFDQVSSGRIRHGTRLLRWREDKAPEECGFDQLSQG